MCLVTGSLRPCSLADFSSQPQADLVEVCTIHPTSLGSVVFVHIDRLAAETNVDFVFLVSICIEVNRLTLTRFSPEEIDAFLRPAEVTELGAESAD